MHSTRNLEPEESAWESVFPHCHRLACPWAWEEVQKEWGKERDGLSWTWNCLSCWLERDRKQSTYNLLRKAQHLASTENVLLQWPEVLSVHSQNSSLCGRSSWYETKGGKNEKRALEHSSLEGLWRENIWDHLRFGACTWLLRNVTCSWRSRSVSSITTLYPNSPLPLNVATQLSIEQHASYPFMDWILGWTHTWSWRAESFGITEKSATPADWWCLFAPCMTPHSLQSRGNRGSERFRIESWP